MQRWNLKVMQRGSRALLVAAAAAAVALPLAAAARAGHGHHDGKRLEARLERLDLEPAAQAAVDQILDADRERQRAARRQIREERERMRSLLLEADEATLLAQAERIGALELEAHKARIATQLALRRVLTPEQQTLLLTEPERGEHERGCHDKR